MEWMILPLKRYFDFSGRSRRKEYWMYTLFLVIVSIVLAILDNALGLDGSATADPADPFGAASGGLLGNIFALGTLIPSLAVSVRRLHDLDRSGWWILLPMGPILVGAVLLGVGMVQSLGGMGGGTSSLMVVGGIALFAGFICSIVLLVWYCTAGTAGPNRFGEDPKGADLDAPEVFG
ncbi:DUF805 domain-containing protein [Sphingomonas sp. CCH9-H8]|uniref:DUF805 domain-containing protein n=2 Tax=Sphingomonas TaxID=13687 RepID=UPI00082E0EF6|nr:DUF805 domain-containing protein [Sphingomonas sp. CCH9-H8]